MILSDCTDRNVAGVNESSFSVPVLLQTRSDRRKPPFQVDARRVFFFVLFCFFCHLQLIYLHPILIPVTPSCSLSPLQNQYFQVSRCSEILLHAKKYFPKYYGYLAP